MASAFSKIFDKYKTYDTSEGFGSREEWQNSFQQRMGFKDAQRILKDDSPFSILGVSEKATFDEIKSAYRKLAMIHHPDKNPDNIESATEMMKKLTAAYVILKKKFGK